MEPKSYTLETMDDLLSIPPDRIGICLAELADVLRPLCAMRQAFGSDKVKLNSPMIWTDDGKEDVTITAQVTADGKQVAEIKTTIPGHQCPS